VNWLHAGVEGRIPAIADLRGQVVLVHTWGYYCSPCMRESVPYVVDLMEARRADGLRAYSITVPISDGKPEDHFVGVGREMGIEHPMGYADGYGGMSPYVNMNVNKGLTWCFVIGREGGVRWAGDPSIDDEEFLDAVRAALFEEPLPPLPEEVPEVLEEAVRSYVAGDLVRASGEIERVLAKHRKTGEPEVASVVAAATGLRAQIEQHRVELLGRLEAAFEERDAESYLAAREPLLARFRKSDAADRVAELDAEGKRDDAFRHELERWRDWNELRSAAPVLFPARVDRETERWAKKLRKYVERSEEGTPGRDDARRMLEALSAR
jgi:hypothetical protein